MAPELVFYRDGQVEGVKCYRIGVVLINAVKERMEVSQGKDQHPRVKWMDFNGVMDSTLPHFTDSQALLLDS